VNERIADLTGLLNETGVNLFICECSDPACAVALEVTLEEYEAVRSDPARFHCPGRPSNARGRARRRRQSPLRGGREHRSSRRDRDCLCLAPAMSSTAHTREAAPVDAGPARPQLLFFYSSSSGHSHRVEGFLAQVLQRRRNHETFRVYRLDYEQHNDLARRCGISELPALVVVEGKHVESRIERPRGCREIQKALAPWLR